MKSIFNFSLAAILVVSLAACGSNAAKDKKAEANDLKVKLEELRKEKKGLDEQIRQVEEKLGKADPSAVQVKKLVSLDTVRITDFAHYIELQGKVDAKNSAYVAPRGGPGVVKGIYVTQGQTVRKGQLLVKLEDAVQRQSVSLAQQAVPGAESNAKLQQSIYERQQNLWKQNIGSEVQVLQAKTNAENAQSQLNSARAQVRQAQAALNLTNVYAEVSGTIDVLDLRVGETLVGTKGNGDPQISIVNTNSLKVHIPVPENYLSKISVGTPLEVKFPELGNRQVSTKVSLVSRQIDPGTRSFIIEGTLPADKSFRPNQIAEARILDYKVSSTIAIPVNVVQTDEKGKYVFVAEKAGDKVVARRKYLTVGEVYGGLMEIKSGLVAGDQIITEGYQTLYDGQAITTTLK